MKNLPANLRPREKLLAFGPALLTDAELLALLLRTGMKGVGVLAWAEQILLQMGGLNGLLSNDALQKTTIKGLGPAKRAELLAVTELTRRAHLAQMKQEPVLNSSLLVRQYLQMQMGQLPHEVFCVLYLDAQNRLLVCEELFRGTLTQTSVYPREVVKRALHHNAAAVILAHNHPSGVLDPSRADQLLTQNLQASLALVDVRILDHMVVGPTGVASFAEQGLL